MNRRCLRRPPTRAPSRGFTLIEVLVVMLIAGLLVGLVVISIGALGDDREIEREAQRMRSLIQLAGDEAELQGRDFGIEFILQGYRFVEYDPLFEQWSEIVGDEVLRPRRLPEGYEMELFVEGRRVELNEVAAETQRDENESQRLQSYAPHGLILSSGDLSPLSVDIVRRADDASVRVRIDLNGNVELGEEDDTDA